MFSYCFHDVLAQGVGLPIMTNAGRPRWMHWVVIVEWSAKSNPKLKRSLVYRTLCVSCSYCHLLLPTWRESKDLDFLIWVWTRFSFGVRGNVIILLPTLRMLICSAFWSAVQALFENRREIRISLRHWRQQPFCYQVVRLRRRRNLLGFAICPG